MPKTADAMISDLVGTFTDPIIVYPGGWGDTLPDWLKEAITLERLETNIKASKGEEPGGTDAEVCAYLYTAGLTVPMDHDWSQIYLYVATMTYRHWNKGEMPADIAVDSIKNSINAVRRDLPDEAIESEKKSASHGRQPVLVS